MSQNPPKNEKVPPQNIDAEMSLLGSILLDKECMLKIVDVITPEDFYKNIHQGIFEVMLDLYSKNEPIDVLTLGNRLEELKKLELIGGRSYLIRLSNATPTSAHIIKYANIIKRKSTHRKLLTAAGQITKLGYSEEREDVETLLDEAQQLLFNVTQKYHKENFIPIRSILDETFERIDKLHRERGTLRGVTSGFKNLDNRLAGFQKSDLIILAARPSVGKTSLALDFARHAAIRGKAKIGLFSLEMSKEQLVDRLLCSEADVDLWKMRTGNLSDRPDSQDFPRIGHAMGLLSEAKIFIDDTPGQNVLQIRTKARRLQSEHGLDMIIIDYLQLMNPTTVNKNQGRVQEVAEMSRGLKLLAREINVPVVCLSQLSRAVEQSKPAIPKLSHLRDSGSIEQDADVVMFIYRKTSDRNYRLEDIPPDERGIGEIHIAKHRNGPTGLVKLFFDETKASFKNLDTNFPEPQTAPPAEQAQPAGVPQF